MTWRKSSFTETNNCVEVREDLHDDRTAVRDSKRPEVTLPVSRSAFRHLRTFAQVTR